MCVCCAGVVSHRQSPGSWHQPLSQSDLGIMRADQWEARTVSTPGGKLTTMVMLSPGIWHLTMPGLMRPHETVSSHSECHLGPGSGYSWLIIRNFEASESPNSGLLLTQVSHSSGCLKSEMRAGLWFVFLLLRVCLGRGSPPRLSEDGSAGKETRVSPRKGR